MSFDFRPRGRIEGILITIGSLVLLLGAAAFSLLRGRHPEAAEEDFEDPDMEDAEPADGGPEEAEPEEDGPDLTETSGQAEAAREQETSAADGGPEGENE